jgi:hypothetical protein
MWIKLSKDQYTILQKFADGQSNVHDAQEILVGMITGVTISNVGTTANFSMWLEQKTGASLDGILKVNVESTAKFSVVYSPRNENLNLLVRIKSLNLFLCSSYKKLKNLLVLSQRTGAHCEDWSKEKAGSY